MALNRETKDWSEYLSVDFDNPVYVNPLIGKEQMRYWYKKAYRDYYTCPRVWLNGIKSLFWNGGFHRYLRGFNAVQSLIFHKAS